MQYERTGSSRAKNRPRSSPWVVGGVDDLLGRDRAAGGPYPARLDPHSAGVLEHR
jgi:hypothetical protein